MQPPPHSPWRTRAWRLLRPLRRLSALLFSLGLGLGGFLAPAQAMDRDLALSQFHHTSWTAKDGAPLSTEQVEVTVDGWLWLGGLRGLYRFDGLQFERFEPPADRPFPSLRVVHLRAAPNGDLWVAFASGGLSRIRRGEVTHFGAAQGLPKQGIRGIQVDLDGTVWAHTPAEFFRFDGVRWVGVGPSWGLLPGEMRILGIVVDGEGTLWFVESRGTWTLRRGQQAFTRAPVEFAGSSLQDIRGRVWAITHRQMSPMHRPDQPGAPSVHPWIGRRHSSMLVDNDHNLWSAFCETGLCRTLLPQPLPDGPVELSTEPERFDRRDGLSGNAVTQMIEDPTRSLWVATQTGLDRFRRSLLVPVALPDGFARHLLAEADGSVTVLGMGSKTYSEPRRWRVDRRAELLPERWGALAAHRDRAGRVWLASQEGLIGPDRPDTLIPWPDGVASPRSMSIASDAAGLWIARPGMPLLRYDLAAARFVTPDEPALRKERPLAVAVAADGSAWFTGGDNRVLWLKDGQLRSLAAADGLDIGSVAVVHAGGRVFAAGEAGVSQLHGGRFQRVRADEPEILSSVASIIETPDGQVWFNGLKGLVRVAAADLDQQARNPGHRLRYRLLDQMDGHNGSVRPGGASAVAGADGRLWFLTSPGTLVWLDPRRLDEPVPAPMPAVRRLEAAGAVHRDARAVELPPLTQAVNLHYTALGAAIPERVRFRYRLEGLETAWTEAGPRREVSYANLGPGAYVFNVLADAGDGAWSGSPATLAFSIRPAFFQTAAFKALCAVAAGALLWLLYRLRVRQLEARAQQQLGVRLNERERIARDLHDTLLQGVTGLTLHVRAAASQVAPDSPVRARLEHALTRANEVMVEGRERVGALRRVQTGAGELESRLRCAAEELAAQWGGDTTHELLIVDAPRPLHAAVADEAYWIAREALVNAFRHAGARHITVRLHYGPKALELEVRDDGSGFDTTAPRPQGHFGLAGLQERATRIEARLDLHSSATGTVVKLTVPGALVYANA